MQRFWNATASVLAVFGVCCLASSGLADDEDGERRIRREVRILGGENQHWLGVALGTVDEALKSQLEIKGGVIVQQVFPDSPAAKAGVKPHDILLKLGDQELTSVGVLLEAVRENKDQETTVTLLRKGDRRTVEIQPVKRSANEFILAAPGGEQERDLHVILREWLEDHPGQAAGRRFGLRFVGPGIFAEGDELELAQLPGDLQISITKQGDTPAKIVVKQQGKNWEVTEGDLSDLPEEIRAHVKRMLGRGAPHRGVMRLKAVRRGDAEFEVEEDGEDVGVRRRGRIEARPLIVPEEFSKMRKSFEEMRRHLDGDTLKELRREIESLRREVEKLRESPSDKKDA